MNGHMKMNYVIDLLIKFIVLPSFVYLLGNHIYDLSGQKVAAYRDNIL
jgi:hypothetical protein